MTNRCCKLVNDQLSILLGSAKRRHRFLMLDADEIASASREEILKLIQAILRKKETEEPGRIYAVLEALEFR